MNSIVGDGESVSGGSCAPRNELDSVETRLPRPLRTQVLDYDLVRRLEASTVRPKTLYPSLISVESNDSASGSNTPRRDPAIKPRRQLFARRRINSEDNEPVIPHLYSVSRPPFGTTERNDTISNQEDGSISIISDASDSVSDTGSVVIGKNVPSSRWNKVITKYFTWGRSKEDSGKNPNSSKESKKKSSSEKLSENSVKDSIKGSGNNLSQSATKEPVNELRKDSSKNTSRELFENLSRVSSRLYQTATENNARESSILDSTISSEPHIIATQHEGKTPPWAFRPRNLVTGAPFSFILPRTNPLCPTPIRRSNKRSQTMATGRAYAAPNVEMPKYIPPLSKVALKLFIPRFARWAQARQVQGLEGKLYLPLAIISPTAQQYFLINSSEQTDNTISWNQFVDNFLTNCPMDTDDAKTVLEVMSEKQLAQEKGSSYIQKLRSRIVDDWVKYDEKELVALMVKGLHPHIQQFLECPGMPDYYNTLMSVLRKYEERGLHTLYQVIQPAAVNSEVGNTKIVNNIEAKEYDPMDEIAGKVAEKIQAVMKINEQASAPNREWQQYPQQNNSQPQRGAFRGRGYQRGRYDGGERGSRGGGQSYPGRPVYCNFHRMEGHHTNECNALKRRQYNQNGGERNENRPQGNYLGRTD